jgi:hypothetical protein
MSSKEEDQKVDLDTSAEEKSLSCNLTFQNAIEIDFSKLREMAKSESESEVKLTPLSEESFEPMSESVSAPVLSGGSGRIERDLSVYDKPKETNDPDSSSDEEEEEDVLRDQEDEPETEVENSEDNSEEEDGVSMQYEQLGSTEYTKATSDDDEEDAHSDGEFGEFESCPASTQSSHMSSHKGVTSVEEQEGEEEVVDRTRDVLGDSHPRTPARAIPPLSQDKIAIIKKTMAGLTLKPSAGAGE